MAHWLIITTVDVLARPNNREHHLIRHLSGRFESTTVVFRRRCVRGGWGARLRDAAVPSAAVTERDGIRYVAVNPPMNHAEGMVRDEPGPAGSGRRRAILRILRPLLGPLGILKDLSTIAALAAASAIHGPRGRSVLCTALGPWAAAAAWGLAAPGLVGPWIYEDRDYEPGFIESPMRRAFAARMERFGIRRAAAVITIGRRLARLREDCGRSPFLVPTGTDLPAAGAPAPARAPTVIYVGNLAGWALLDRAVDALAIVRETVPDARLEILGEGTPAMLAHLSERVAARGLAPAVDFGGSIPHGEIAGRLRAASIGYAVFEPSPLRTYAVPLKVAEYMAAGLPVLTTADTESGDIVAEHGCGLAVEPDPEAIAGAILRLLGDRDLREAQSRAGIRAAADLEWSRLLDREWSIMRRLIASGDRLERGADLALPGQDRPA